jgi:hypothetical protein
MDNAWAQKKYGEMREMLSGWAAIWGQLSPEVRTAITAAHDRHKYECCGYSEGQWCCIDFMDGSAEETLRDMIAKG